MRIKAITILSMFVLAVMFQSFVSSNSISISCSGAGACSITLPDGTVVNSTRSAHISK